MSVILKQLEELKRVIEVSAEFSDLISVDKLAEMNDAKDKHHIRTYLIEKGIKPVGKLGQTVFFSKSKVLELIKNTA